MQSIKGAGHWWQIKETVGPGRQGEDWSDAVSNVRGFSVVTVCAGVMYAPHHPHPAGRGQQEGRGGGGVQGRGRRTHTACTVETGRDMAD